MRRDARERMLATAEATVINPQKPTLCEHKKCVQTVHLKWPSSNSIAASHDSAPIPFLNQSVLFLHYLHGVAQVKPFNTLFLQSIKDPIFLVCWLTPCKGKIRNNAHHAAVGQCESPTRSRIKHILAAEAIATHLQKPNICQHQQSIQTMHLNWP